VAALDGVESVDARELEARSDGWQPLEEEDQSESELGRIANGREKNTKASNWSKKGKPLNC
jgi:hypothetical protein